MKKLYLLLTLFVIVLTSCNTSTLVSEADNHEHIRFNQLGYYPDAIKEFVVADYEATSFQILNEKGKKTFEGELIKKGTWESSGETILKCDFSTINKTGSYTIQLNTGLTSAPFEIARGLYGAALDASIKSFYFQRASMAIE